MQEEVLAYPASEIWDVIEQHSPNFDNLLAALLQSEMRGH